MFAPMGFVSLFDFSEALYTRIHRSHVRPDPKDYEGLPEYEYPNAHACFRHEVWEDFTDRGWAFLDNAPAKTGILASSGMIIPASDKLFSAQVPFEASGDYVDLTIGTVGSGGRAELFLPGEIEFATSEEQKERARLSRMSSLFGPFLHCPIVIPSGPAQSYLENPWAGVSQRDVRPDKEIIAEIIRMFDADRTVTQAQIRRQVCPLLPVASFRSIWDNAKKHRPLLGKRGPKPRLSPPEYGIYAT